MNCKADNYPITALTSSFFPLNKGNLAAMKSEAERMILSAQVEAQATQALDAQRKHELALKETSLWSEFAKNGDLRLLGGHGDALLNSLMQKQLKSVIA